MSYSCTDFTDAILEALCITVPAEHGDDPERQADLACGEIYRLEEAGANSLKLLEMLDRIHRLIETRIRLQQRPTWSASI